MKLARSALIGLCVVVTGLTLSACREAEQGRPLAHNKGVYQGTPDQKLPPAQVRSLALQTERQGSK